MRLFLLVIIVISFAADAYAQNPPQPRKKNISREYLDSRLSEEKKQQKDIGQELEQVKGDLEKTRKRLVKTAKSMQENEQKLQNIDVKTQKLEDEKASLEEKLKQDSIAISKLVTALERIRRVPPQALMVRPEAPLKTAQSAMMLSDIIPVLNEKSQTLKKDLERKEDISNELAREKDKALKSIAELQKEQEEIKELLEKREALYKKTSLDFKSQQIEVQKISRQSRNLKELVSRIDENQRRQKTRDSVRQAVLSAPAIKMPDSGATRLPISGVIKTRYHDLDKFGAKSEGIRIEGRSNAIVVAPMPGIIRFAGPFKNYDNMIIIEHPDGYHSLVAGLSQVNTLVGQTVSAGEPLGTLKSTTNGSKPALYYELRYNGRAVNPAKKFSDLG